jgi:hypothetical protein
VLYGLLFFCVKLRCGVKVRKVTIRELRSAPIHWVINQTHIEKQATKHRIIIPMMAIYLLGDPDLQYLAWLGDLKIYVVAAALSLASIPWIASSLDPRTVTAPTPSLCITRKVASGSPLLLQDKTVRARQNFPMSAFGWKC